MARATVSVITLPAVSVVPSSLSLTRWGAISATTASATVSTSIAATVVPAAVTVTAPAASPLPVAAPFPGAAAIVSTGAGANDIGDDTPRPATSALLFVYLVLGFPVNAARVGRGVRPRSRPVLPLPNDACKEDEGRGGGGIQFKCSLPSVVILP